MLHAPRKGWQNEHLGLYLLSRLAFCANPVTVSDDLGSDFFCCLFKITGSGKRKSVSPLSSFAIQIKSSPGSFDVSGKVSYLADLELPYFVGVVSQKRTTMDVYSGEYLPMLFSQVGATSIRRLRIVPTNSRVGVGSYYNSFGQGKIRVQFPRVLTLRGTESEKAFRSQVSLLHDLCRRVHGNIATRRTDEHIYAVPTRRKYLMMAGSGSAKVFRENHQKRLAEACFNFVWLLRNYPQRVDLDEIEMYLRFVADLRQFHKRLPSYLNRAVRELKLQLATTRGG